MFDGCHMVKPGIAYRPRDKRLMVDPVMLDGWRGLKRADGENVEDWIASAVASALRTVRRYCPEFIVRNITVLYGDQGIPGG